MKIPKKAYNIVLILAVSSVLVLVSLDVFVNKQDATEEALILLPLLAGWFLNPKAKE